MIYYFTDINRLCKTNIIGKEHLTENILHKSRTASEYIVYYIISGKLELNDNGNDILLLPGDFCFFSKGDYHFPLKSSECIYYYFHFDGAFETKLIENEKAFFSEKRISFMQGKADSSIAIPKHYNIKSEKSQKHIKKLFFDAIEARKNINDDYNMSISSIKLQEIFIEVYRDLINDILYSENENHKTIINSIIKYIYEHKSEKITGDILEKNIGYNFDYMNRLFSAATGKTITNYLTIERIKSAAELLKIKNITISDAASQLGFCDVYYFSKVFKKVTGITPAKYLKMQK